ncbi:apolipoprotein N-acyltransferase [Paracoccus jeotgali]|uniref:apolipoprotein N-acyltransferase n=1 Tax=Paracoccus jeotgali TaxID=2065379 RepID=UPI0028A8A287|nr:apolipoprotein N-acyltransferase [Paracoccus jeotgali]
MTARPRSAVPPMRARSSRLATDRARMRVTGPQRDDAPRAPSPRSGPGALLRRPLKVWRLVGFLLLGAVIALGQQPWGLWLLSLLALALALHGSAAAPSARATALRAGLVGTGFFALAMSWITEPFLVQPEIHGWMAPFALILMALGGGAFWAIPGWLAGRLTPPGPRRVGALAALLLIFEWLRGWIFTGLPWAMLGHGWIDTPPAQAAALVGAIGLSALMLMLAALPAMIWRSGAGRGRTAAALLLPLGLLGLVWLAGTARLATPIQPRGITLRLVQPDADQALKWDPDWAQIFWDRLLSESAAPPTGPAPDAVIWPETAVSFLLNNADEALAVASQAAGAPVLMGIQRAEDRRYFNALIEVAPGGEVVQTYDKFHLVPFGEYIPLGDRLARLGIGAFAAQQGFGYTPGPGPQVLHPQGLPRMQPLICYEAIFPQHIRATEGAEWLLQVTNDAWFGTLSGPYQHLAQARLRAIESGLPLMRAANTGVTAAIDPLGRVTDWLPLGAVGHIDAALPAPLPRTLWLRLGPWPVLLAGLLVLLGCVLWPGRARART